MSVINIALQTAAKPVDGFHQLPGDDDIPGGGIKSCLIQRFSGQHFDMADQFLQLADKISNTGLIIILGNIQEEKRRADFFGQMPECFDVAVA